MRTALRWHGTDSGLVQVNGKAKLAFWDDIPAFWLAEDGCQGCKKGCGSCNETLAPRGVSRGCAVVERGRSWVQGGDVLRHSCEPLQIRVCRQAQLYI